MTDACWGGFSGLKELSKSPAFCHFTADDRLLHTLTYEIFMTKISLTKNNCAFQTSYPQGPNTKTHKHRILLLLSRNRLPAKIILLHIGAPIDSYLSNKFVKQYFLLNSFKALNLKGNNSCLAGNR